MKYWCELQKDAFTHFKWFGEKKTEKMDGNLHLSIFSVVGSRIVGLDEKNFFQERCSKSLEKVFNDIKLFNQYKLYLVAVVETPASSRIAAYRKVWRNLQLKFDIDKFNKGPEIETTVEDKVIYASIAEFKIEDIITALRVVVSNPKKFTIIASPKNNLHTVEMIEAIFNVAFEADQELNSEINYFHLSIFLCPQENIIFRWGDSSEEAELDLIFDQKLLKSFQNIDLDAKI